jgi:DNA-binding response OmpR family regulator
LLVDGPRPRGLGPAATRRWLGRPFSPRQLVTLVREVLPQKPASAGPGSAGAGSAGSGFGSGTGRLRLDGASRAALADGKRVPLTATEFAMLAAMADRPGRVLSRRQLLAAAGRQAAGDRAADVYIAQLRAKIGAAGQIRTARGAGYAMDPLQGGQ